EAIKAGQKPDEKLAAQAKLRSKQNTFMAVPVVFLMISNHFGGSVTGGYDWIYVAMLVPLGWLAPQFFCPAWNLDGSSFSICTISSNSCLPTGITDKRDWRTRSKSRNLALDRISARETARGKAFNGLMSTATQDGSSAVGSGYAVFIICATPTTLFSLPV